MDRDSKRLQKQLGIQPGDIYDSCDFHPCVCVEVDYEGDEIWGVSLIDGTWGHSCSLMHCGVVKLTVAEAWRIKMKGPISPSDRRRIPRERRWWSATSRGDPWKATNGAKRKFEEVTRHPKSR